MKHSTLHLSLLLLSSAALTNAAALADRAVSSSTCPQEAYQEGGNWFCQAVGQITYTNVGASGTYDDVVHMDQDTGACTTAKRRFGGALAPFNEPLSVHLRGPIRLKQMAVYTRGTGGTKRAEADEISGPDLGSAGRREKRRRHLARHFRRHTDAPEPDKTEREQPHETHEKRDAHPTIWVTAVINGQTVSWINDYWGDEPTPAPAPSPTGVSGGSVPSAPVPAAARPTQAPDAAGGSGEFARVGYYDAARQQAQGVMFLANYGGIGSGKWTPTFGNTLSYVDATGSTGAAEPHILADTTIHSDKEIVIMTDQNCDDGSCGYVQPGSVAYKGFSGHDLTLLFEFQMPHDSSADQPALWLLNARIPQTQQYGPCSCWKSGCGEFDVFEVLAPGDAKCKSTFHSVFAAGDPNYFDRPADAPVRVAVAFDGAGTAVSVKVLSPGGDEGVGTGSFPATMSAAQVRRLRADDGDGAGLLASSRFAVGT